MEEGRERRDDAKETEAVVSSKRTGVLPQTTKAVSAQFLKMHLGICLAERLLRNAGLYIYEQKS